MAQLQSQLSTLTNSISTINNQIQVIANEVRGIAAERGLGGRNISLTTTGTAYHLKALVPGRAWVQSAHGALTSVTIGDRLPGYGIIQMINIAQGIVTTSSGAIIQYGQRDS
jgi:intracellular multiplication protein IcmG